MVKSLTNKNKKEQLGEMPSCLEEGSGIGQLGSLLNIQ